MNELWKTIAVNAGDGKTFIEDVSKNGIRFLKSNLDRLPLFSSIRTSESGENDRDERHFGST